MAKRTVANLNIRIGASGAALRRDFDRAGRQVRGFGATAGKSLSGLTKGAGAAGAAMAALAVSIGAAAKGLRTFLHHADEMEDISRTADKLGLATEELVGLQMAAERTGSSASTLDMALQRMTRRISEAAIGTGEARGALEELGLSAQDLNRAGPAEAFRRIAEAIQRVENPADRLRLAFKLFDSEGAELVNTLELGRKGLDAIAREAERTGVAFDAVDAARIEQANEAIQKLSDSWKGLMRDFASFAAPGIERMAGWLTQLREFFGYEPERKAGKLAEALNRVKPPSPEPIKKLTEEVSKLDDELEKVKFDEWDSIGERIADSIKTPVDRVKDSIMEIEEAFRRGKIPVDVYGSAIENAKARLDEALAAKEDLASPFKMPSVNVGAVSRGTFAGVAAVREGQNALRGVAAAMRRSEELAKREAARDRKRNEILDSIRDEIATRTPIKVSTTKII